MGIVNDGHSTTVAFTVGISGVILSALLQEKTVTPPGISGGGENDTTTMRNTAWRTKQPKQLKSLTEMTMTCAYDAAVFTEMNDMVNQNQEIVLTYPDGETLTFWGWLDNYAPNEMSEGEQPTAEVTVICSNQNNAGAEVAPVIA